MEQKENCYTVIDSMADCMVSRERMKEYLGMAACFPQMEYENLLLLLKQIPEASFVCGRVAWEQYGAAVRPGERAAALLSVSCRDKKSPPAYSMVGVYDRSQLEKGIEKAELWKKKVLREPLDHLLRNRYQVVIMEDVGGEYITHPLKKSVYVEEEKILYVKSRLPDDVRQEELLKCFLFCFFRDYPELPYREESGEYLKIVLSGYFGLPCRNTEIHFSELFGESVEEKKRFLRQFSELYLKVFTVLTGKIMFTFMETGLCNSYFDKPDFRETVSSIGAVMETVEKGTGLWNVLQGFLEKLCRCTGEQYRELKEKRDAMNLFTCPPVVIDTGQ